MIIAVAAIDDVSRALVEEYGGLVQLARTDDPIKCITLVTLPESSTVHRQGYSYHRWDVTLVCQEKPAVCLEMQISYDSLYSFLHYIRSESDYGY